MTEVFNRYEHKYLVCGDIFHDLINDINIYMKPDEYNIDGLTYSIANIYYDTRYDELIRKSVSKPAYKEKLRIRSYEKNIDIDSNVFVEIKKKYHGIVGKRRIELRLADAYRFLETGFVRDYQMCFNLPNYKEIQYLIQRYCVMPRVYIAYDRFAFFEENNPDLRISFDTNIRSRRFELRFEDGDHGQALLPTGTWVMEIKTSCAKPLWLTKLLCKYGLKRCHFSKYGIEYRKYCQTKLYMAR